VTHRLFLRGLPLILPIFAAAVAVTLTLPIASGSAGDDPIVLPRPGATPSATKVSKVVPRPEGALLKVPDGFRAEVLAENLDRPRWMTIAPDGNLFVAESRANRITVFPAGNGGKLGPPVAFTTQVNAPFGMAFHEGYLYVGNTDSIVRFQYKPGQTVSSGEPQKITDLPGGAVQPGRGGGGHWTRNLIFSPDKKKMFVAVGSASNNSIGDDSSRAAINEYNPDGSGHRVYASGLRNPVGLAFFPGSNILWTVVNERDRLGDDLVPDYATAVKENGFYGWPYSYIGKNYDPEHEGKRPELVEKAIVPDVLLPPHGAPLGLAFYTGKQFPSDYQNSAFVALHGSWNRSHFSGYQVVRIPFKNGRPSGKPETFLSGWIVSDEDATVWGRPVGLLVWSDGSLLVADDGGNRIWKVSYGRN
jgi:glucose/arabinose dehydrogenase